jgi:hypothetical protein
MQEVIIMLSSGDFGIVGILTVSVGHDYRSSFPSLIRKEGVKYWLFGLLIQILKC